MVENRFINEAEMFCTDLEFRADDQGHVFNYIGDVYKKNEDVKAQVSERLNELCV